MTRSAIVNAFASTPFGGNPAGVVLLDDASTVSDYWMQSVAAQFGYAETAFITESPGRGWNLRWFTPTVEVELCGHATLACAHWLWEQGLARPAEPLRFATASGVLTAARRGAQIVLDFPRREVVPTTPPGGWRQALPGVEAEWIGSTTDRPATEQNSIILTTASDLRRLRPDLGFMRSSDVLGWIITAPADEAAGDADIVSRYFAPAIGVDEDPVTGSAHCALASFWSGRLGRTSFRARQLSARGGVLEIALQGADRVALAGSAVTVAQVQLLV